MNLFFLSDVGNISGIESLAIDVISKFGVIAVLWYWLRQVQSQMKTQSINFQEQIDSLYEKHKEEVERLSLSHKEEVERLTSMFDYYQNNLDSTSKIRPK